MGEPVKRCYTYDQIHKFVLACGKQIKEEFDPDIIVAIGGGGFIPARMLRTHLKIRILAVGIEFYDATDKQMGSPRKKQWLDDLNLAAVQGKKVLIVDEVDDTRTTLRYCVDELVKHNVSACGIFVVQNKDKEKRATLPANVPYFCAETIPDIWVGYPWDAHDIDQHNEKSLQWTINGEV